MSIKRGRPPSLNPMQQYRVSLDTATVAALRTLGEGNLSLGIRRAAKARKS
mgnify:CR=1 FL=1